MANYRVVNPNQQDRTLGLEGGSPLRIPAGQAVLVDSRTLARLSSDADLTSNGIHIQAESGDQVRIEDIRNDSARQEVQKEAAHFIAQIDHLFQRVRIAEVKTGQETIECLQEWRRCAELGNINFSKDQDKILEELNKMVSNTIHTGTLGRRVRNPIAGVAVWVYAVPVGLVWLGSYFAEGLTVLGVSLAFISAVALFGTIGSLFRVLFKAVTHDYIETDRTALYLIGVARPIMGGILALFVGALFASGIVVLPVENPDRVITFIGGQIEAGKLAILALAFLAGVSDELVMNLVSKAGGQISGQGRQR